MSEEKKEEDICQHCGMVPGVRHRQNTSYCEEEKNWITLCEECQKINDENWNDMWEEYYSGLLFGSL